MIETYYLKDQKYRGFKIIDSSYPSGKFGINRAGIGDFNGDGINDFCVVSSPPLDKSMYATVYVIWGRLHYPKILDLTTFNKSWGFKIANLEDDVVLGSATPFFPKTNGFMPLLQHTRCSSAGDINHDGFNDLLIGVPGTDVNFKSNSGAAHVIFGSQEVFPELFDLTMLNGNNGFTFYGNKGAEDYFDTSITHEKFNKVFNYLYSVPSKYNLAHGDGTGIFINSIGDINGDKIDDIAIAATLAKTKSGTCPIPNHIKEQDFLYNQYMFNGKVYIMYGSDKGFNATYTADNLNGHNGFTIEGGPDDTLGMNIAALDINDDGLQDIVLGAHCGCSDNNQFWHGGKAYVLFGQTSFPNFFNVQTYIASHSEGNNQTSRGFTIHGKEDNAWLGETVSPLGDVNGDKIDDLLIDSRGVNEKAGEAYILFGSKDYQNFKTDILIDSNFHNYGVTLVLGSRPHGFGGFGLKSILGDINSDGVNDIFFASSTVFKTSTVLYGKTEQWNQSIIYTDNINEREGFSIKYAPDNFYNKLSDLAYSTLPFPIISYVLEILSSEYILMGGHLDAGHLGDINSDGVVDLAINLVGKHSTPGELHILFGPL